MYRKFVNTIVIINLILAGIILILGFIPSDNWMADATYIICGGAQLIATVLIPLRMRNVPKDGADLAAAEVFVQSNWVIIALGMAGACTYLAEFVAPNNPLIAYVAFCAGLLTLLVGIFSMYKSVKMTGVDLMI